MSLSKLIRNGVASVVIVAMPVSASFAATRPNAAVPAAGSTAVAAQYVDDDRDGYSNLYWPALAVIVFTALVAIWIATKDSDIEGDLSPG